MKHTIALLSRSRALFIVVVVVVLVITTTNKQAVDSFNCVLSVLYPKEQPTTPSLLAKVDLHFFTFNLAPYFCHIPTNLTSFSILQPILLQPTLLHPNYSLFNKEAVKVLTM